VIDNATRLVAKAYAKAYNQEMRTRQLGGCDALYGWLWLPDKISPLAAFYAIHGGPITFWRMSETSKEYLKKDATWYAMEKGGRNIYVFKNFTEATLGKDPLRMTNLFIHEIGHAFDEAIEQESATFPSKSVSSKYQNEKGFAGGYEFWQFHTKDNDVEYFADMFIGWVYEKWDVSKGVLTDPAKERRDFMDSRMPGWIVNAIGDTR
jgi:hypothetical protein